MTGVRLRKLTPADTADAVRLAADFHNASVYRHHPLALDKVDALIGNALRHPDYFNVVLADAASNRVEGYLLALCHEHYFSYKKTVTDLGFYITEDYRTPFAARGMLKELEAWAFGVKQAGEIALGVSSGIADAATVRFYERCGFTRGWYGVIKARRGP
jgi:RimJ/RimL family protein N-acetyltransferase